MDDAQPDLAQPCIQAAAGGQPVVCVRSTGDRPRAKGASNTALKSPKPAVMMKFLRRIAALHGYAFSGAYASRNVSAQSRLTGPEVRAEFPQFIDG